MQHATPHHQHKKVDDDEAFSLPSLIFFLNMYLPAQSPGRPSAPRRPASPAPAASRAGSSLSRFGLGPIARRSYVFGVSVCVCVDWDVCV